MKAVALLISGLSASKCSSSIEVNGIPMSFDGSMYTDSLGMAKLARNELDGSWMYLNRDLDPVVSFDKGECADNNDKWYRLNTLQYHPTDMSIKPTNHF